MSGYLFSRRHFFYGVLLAGAVPAAGYGQTRSLRRLGYKSPNEKLNIAAIGAGGRAEINLAGCADENIVAFADPDENRASATYGEYPNAPKYRDFRKMLDKERANIDAVLITIPDHMHAAAALWCMERGKHVYLEKPLARTIGEARMLAEAARKYGVATQMGNQGYSNEATRIAAEIIWSGEIGNVTEVHAWTDRPVWPQGMETLPPAGEVPPTLDWDLWLGVAKMRPYSPAYLPFNWRGYLDFGCGASGDMACHVLGAPNIALMLGQPTSVQLVSQEGRSQYCFPKKSVTRLEFPARPTMPPVTVYWYDGQTGPPYLPKGVPEGEPIIAGPGSIGPAAQTTPRQIPAGAAQAGAGQQMPRPNPAGNGAIFVGDKGYLTTDSHGARARLLPLERMNAYNRPPQLLTRSPGHYRDWIRACKGGEPACSNFAISAPFTEWTLLGAIALRCEGKLEWDSVKMRFTNNSEANRYLRPESIREGWNLKL